MGLVDIHFLHFQQRDTEELDRMAKEFQEVMQRFYTSSTIVSQKQALGYRGMKTYIEVTILVRGTRTRAVGAEVSDGLDEKELIENADASDEEA